MTELAIAQNGRSVQVASKLLEQALIEGDLGQLSTGDRLLYYRQVCDSLGINPLTKPFQLIKFRDGKMQLYATRNCTDQLRDIRKVSVKIVARERLEDTYVVTASAVTPDGRVDESIGAVSLTGLRGEDLANALMKAETKAKRRVTLSICGLSLLDETEVETVSGASRGTIDTATGEIHVDEKPQAKPAKGDHLAAMRTAWKKLQEDGTFLGVVIPEPDLTWTIDDWKREGQNWRAAIRQAEAENEAKAKEG